MAYHQHTVGKNIQYMLHYFKKSAASVEGQAHN